MFGGPALRQAPLERLELPCPRPRQLVAELRDR